MTLDRAQSAPDDGATHVGGAPFAGPLFMVGCARTGSTLLRHVLNRSPRVCLASETHFIEWAEREGLAASLADVRASTGDDAVRGLADRLHRREFWAWIPRNFTREELVARLRGTDLTPRGLFAWLLTTYAERRCGLVPGEGIVGEKTPAHLHHVPTLRSWFPEARFVHTFRDPRGIYLSELRRHRQGRWGPKARLPWLPAGVVDPLLGPIQMVRTTLAWRRAARLHRTYARELGPRYCLVRFEDVVADPEREIRRLCAFAGVAFEPAMLEGTVVVGSSFEQQRHAGSGFDPGAATRWRDGLGLVARRWFSLVLGRELVRFGYPA